MNSSAGMFLAQQFGFPGVYRNDGVHFSKKFAGLKKEPKNLSPFQALRLRLCEAFPHACRQIQHSSMNAEHAWQIAVARDAEGDAAQPAKGVGVDKGYSGLEDERFNQIERHEISAHRNHLLALLFGQTPHGHAGIEIFY